jgi:cysteine synthase
LQIAEARAAAGQAATIVTIFADNGFKYLSGAAYR